MRIIQSVAYEHTLCYLYDIFCIFYCSDFGKTPHPFCCGISMKSTRKIFLTLAGFFLALVFALPAESATLRHADNRWDDDHARDFHALAYGSPRGGSSFLDDGHGHDRHNTPSPESARDGHDTIPMALAGFSSVSRGRHDQGHSGDRRDHHGDRDGYDFRRGHHDGHHGHGGGCDPSAVPLPASFPLFVLALGTLTVAAAFRHARRATAHRSLS